jgi:hypothetical protein
VRGGALCLITVETGGNHRLDAAVIQNAKGDAYCLSNCLATVSTMWLTPSRCFPENGNAGRTAHHPEPEWLSRLINRNRRFGKSP